ncbi:MAG TPA: hypothetical protein VNO33_07670 [Kofleriaceae bacterium]|nr:hypothetical protein [Kofleriaceae bacterium]
MLRRSMRVLSMLFILASPWVLYVTLSQDRIDIAAATLIGWVILRSLPTLIAVKREHLAAALRLPAIALVFALLGWIFDRGWMLLILPSASQTAFGATFLRSLRKTPLVEHFARMVKPELSPAELAHCRSWTFVWGVYLILIAIVGLFFARFASLRAWTLYTGVVCYGLIGLLFAVEYTIRKIRFRDYGKNPVDWLISRLFPGAPC